jgi:hypothetical protein
MPDSTDEERQMRAPSSSPTICGNFFLASALFQKGVVERYSRWNPAHTCEVRVRRSDSSHWSWLH